MEWVVQRGFGVSILGNVHNPTRYEPGQPAVSDPDLIGMLDYTNKKSLLNKSDYLKWFRRWVHQGNIFTEEPAIFYSVAVVG